MIRRNQHLLPALARWALLRFVIASVMLGAGPGAAAPPRVQTVAQGLVNPWSLAFLPEGRFLVTERPGRMRIIEAGGKLGPPLEGLPPVVAKGQGGMLDVALDPDFANNQRVFWSYSEPGQGAASASNGTAVARGRLQGNRLLEVQVIFRQQPKVDSSLHFGGRLAFAPDGKLFLTLGDRFGRKDDAQRLDNHLGKVVRIDTDGKAPADNPLLVRPDLHGSEAAGAPRAAEIWSWGHRNPQGAALHPTTGELWTHEHGPQGGDELNLTLAGRNHGWPLITHGRNYGTGTQIGEGTARADMAAPLTHWAPVSIAPSGMAFLTSERYPGWKGQLFIGALRGETLLRLELEGSKVLRQTRLLDNLHERIRDVRQGPDGWLYLLTDNADGRLLRLLP